jgi:hypothetical protein
MADLGASSERKESLSFCSCSDPPESRAFGDGAGNAVADFSFTILADSPNSTSRSPYLNFRISLAMFGNSLRSKKRIKTTTLGHANEPITLEINVSQSISFLELEL